MIITIDEVNQLFTIRQVVYSIEVGSVNDSRSQSEAGSLGHDHRSECFKFSLDVNCLWWLLLEIKDENPESSQSWLQIRMVWLSRGIHIASGTLEECRCCDFIPVHRWHLLQW